MELEAVSFPALIIADDGWVDYLDRRNSFADWSYSAVRKYNKRRVLLYDNRDCTWQIESIGPIKQPSLFGKIGRLLLNSKFAVRIEVRPITESPMRLVQETLRAAIDADDDILTQDTEAEELKAAVETATSFKSLVAVLRKKRAIVVRNAIPH